MTIICFRYPKKARHHCRAFLLLLFTAVLTLPLLTACQTVSHRKSLLYEQAAREAYTIDTLKTSRHDLLAAYPPQISGTSVTIVIEGDGFAWLDRYTPSDDPTPKTPAVFGYAASLTPQAVYLARPCQFTRNTACDSSFAWTDGRFEAEIIAAYDKALNAIKSRTGAMDFNLSAYSGGAYIAFVLAAKRTDIREVTAIAGVLDPQSWTEHHGVTSLSGLHDQADLLEDSSHVRFKHYCGLKDDIAPCALGQKFIKEAGANHSLYELAGQDHESIVSYMPR